MPPFVCFNYSISTMLFLESFGAGEKIFHSKYLKPFNSSNNIFHFCSNLNIISTNHLRMEFERVPAVSIFT